MYIKEIKVRTSIPMFLMKGMQQKIQGQTIDKTPASQLKPGRMVRNQEKPIMWKWALAVFCFLLLFVCLFVSCGKVNFKSILFYRKQTNKQTSKQTKTKTKTKTKKKTASSQLGDKIKCNIQQCMAHLFHCTLDDWVGPTS